MGIPDYAGAISDFTDAIKLRPKFEVNYNLRGVAKFQINDNTGAVEDFTKAFELNPKNFTHFEYRGRAKARLKDYEGANVCNLHESWHHISGRGFSRCQNPDRQIHRS